MSRKLLFGSLAAVALIATACGSGSSGGSSSDGIASLDSVAPASADAVAGSATDDSDDADVVTEADAEKAFADYEKCLDGIGAGGLLGESGGGDGAVVEGDDAGSSVIVSADIDDDVFERMQEECDPLLADVIGDFELSPEQEAEMRDAELEFSRCMRDEGIEIGDPSGGGGAMQIEVDVDEDFDQDAMDAAFETCDSVFDDLDAQFEASGS